MKCPIPGCDKEIDEKVFSNCAKKYQLESYNKLELKKIEAEKAITTAEDKKKELKEQEEDQKAKAKKEAEKEAEKKIEENKSKYKEEGKKEAEKEAEKENEENKSKYKEEGKKEAEKEKEKLKDENARLKKTIERTGERAIDLEQRLNQTSSELQGTIREDEIEIFLKELFPQDKIKKVKKGENGGDYIHEIYNNNEELLGKIAYEVKNTKNFEKKFIKKLMGDLSLPGVKANIGIIITKSLPRGQKIDADWYLNDIICVCKIKKNLLALAAKTARILIKGQFKKMKAGASDESNSSIEWLRSQEFKQWWTTTVNTDKEIIEVLDTLETLFMNKSRKIKQLITDRKKSNDQALANLQFLIENK